ncbi:hypothetical protein AWV80_30510 [Cupriavidus sp. UYMU48A]|nr:hypothetical protein AWV80_30510 [Cupriavidus sp. UYMU48A]
MYDLQPETSFHYRPLWQPQYELYDARRTQVVMQDWYALKDPRQFYRRGDPNVETIHHGPRKRSDRRIALHLACQGPRERLPST